MITTKTRSVKGDKAIFDDFDRIAKSKGQTFNSMIVQYIKRVTKKND